MTVYLTPEKVTNIRQACQSLLNKQNPTIREVAKTIGKIITSFPGVMHGSLTIDHLNQTKQLPLRPQAKRGNV